MADFKSCDKCRDSDIKGHIIVPVGEGDYYVYECDCHKEWRLKELLPKRLSKSSLPLEIQFSLSDYVGKNSNGNIPKLEEYIHSFNSDYKDKTLYFYGSPRTQKTTVAFAIAGELLKTTINIQYMVTMDKLTKLLSSFENQRTESEKQRIDNITSCDLLIVDECFAKKYASISDHQLGALREFFKDRMEVHRKATILISNEHPTSIKSKGFGEAFQDLIIRNIRGRMLSFEDNVNQVKDDFDLNLLWE